MKLVVALAAALAVAETTSAKLLTPAQHPAGHLFARGDRSSMPVELYNGEDPQASLKVRSTPTTERLHRRHHDHINIFDLAPRDMMDEDGNYLAKRQASTTSPNLNVPYPPAGSDAPDPKLLPKAWVDKYNAAKKAGLIPDVPLAKEDPTAGVAYPAGTDAKKACSWTVSKCNTDDIFEAPDNSVAFGIDDGPTGNGTPKYLDILSDQAISATHFLIGSAIVWNPEAFKKLANASPQQHLGVHTWSHTLQTTKTDLEVLGDLGWVQQIIYDMTGLIPAFWRPPEGDVDARVRAIAKHVLGMQTVLWTHDADDWCLRQGKGTAKSIDSCVKSAPNLKTVQAAEVKWASPKTDNKGWITLNHETTDQSSEAFEAMVKAAKKEKWNVVGTIPDLQGLNWYSNAYSKGDKGTKQDNILPTKDFINVTNPTAAKGSSDAPKLGDWAKTAATSDSSVGAQTKGSNASGSSSSSGAAENVVALALMTVGAIGSALALTL